MDPKASFKAKNEPKDLTPYEANYESKKAILIRIIRQYIERGEIFASNMNIIYGIIWRKCTPVIQLVLKGNIDYPTKSKIFDSLWLMREKNNTPADLDVKLNNSAILYHAIRGFINTIQRKAYSKDTFKLFFHNIYETMELDGGGNILHRKQLTNNDNDASTKEKQLKIYQMKAM